ncbi:MAG: prepilin-type N-terminal cleavage/methylation domain-containing protein [Kiloniellales bacterium]|nr:prepilin-type N-terminal cleavage/methylation domain-containing protein [Kiloniellales bacterium]
MTTGRNDSDVQNAGGFTLLELLIAMTLLGLLMAMLFGGLRFGAGVWARGDAELEQLSRLQIVQNLIRRQIGAALPPVPGGETGPSRYAMEGGPDALTLFAPAPLHAAIGGIYRIALRAEDCPPGTCLVMAWHLDQGQKEPAEAPREEQQVVLLDDIEGLAFDYLAEPAAVEPTPPWQDIWDEPERLPALIRLHVTFDPQDRRSWPALLVAPLAGRR